MRCGRRWPHTTRCCARRSRRTAAFCSSTVRSLDAAAGIDSAAVTLFVERARGIASGFSMATPDEVGAVVFSLTATNWSPSSHGRGLQAGSDHSSLDAAYRKRS